MEFVEFIVFFVFFLLIKDDEFVKSQKVSFSVIPAKAGIQFFQAVINSLDFVFQRSDDFLRDH
ncbi:MAG: hypothetical protein A2Y81_08360 [Nitrospirae bacterium RBG_13_43_8]|nr:MAG: hypothetical protein A2Y81_08360 [Nitrospirae bacterium RBG_13_43_8]